MTYNVVDDTSMAGTNGFPVVEYLDDRLGPMWDALECLFYIYAPTIHWHAVLSLAEDLPTRQVIERLADEAYHFGQHIEEHKRRFLDVMK